MQPLASCAVASGRVGQRDREMVWGANEKTLKIVLAGPLKSGKSVIANFLADDGENLKPGNYNPTAGVRIRECEKALLPGSSVKVPVEIWDASGDQNFESCWPAVLTNAHGVVLVYNPEKPAQEQEVSLWYDYFVRGAGLDDDQCLLLMHRSQTIQSNARLAPPPKLSRVETVSTTFESGPLIKQKFDSFCRSLLGRKPASQPQSMHEQQLRH